MEQSQEKIYYRKVASTISTPHLEAHAVFLDEGEF